MRNDCKELIDTIRKEIADICDVDEQIMLDVGAQQQPFVQARCLLWYAIKHLTNYSNRVIALLTTDRNGKHFTPDSVSKGVAKMALMTGRDFLWQKRWRQVKEVIEGIKKEYDIEDRTRKKITIIAPFDIEVEIKKQ